MYLADSASSGGGAAGTVVSIIIAIIGFGLYWLPTIISAWRRLPHTGSVAVMNIFAFVIVPWWLALMMAVRSQPRPQYVVPGGWGPQQPLPPVPPGFQPPQPYLPQQAQAEVDKPYGYQ